MTLILYTNDISAPARAVLMTAKALGISLNLREVDITKGAQLKPEFVRINPQHTIPTLDDRGFIIWESHAIMVYLVGKYGTDDLLYPRDLERRAVVDQCLYFATGVLFNALHNYSTDIATKKRNFLSQEQISNVKESYAVLEKFLVEHNWVAGDHVTIADLSLIPIVTALNILVPIDRQFPLITNWINRAEDLPYYDQNRIGLENFENYIKPFLNLKKP